MTPGPVQRSRRPRRPRPSPVAGGNAASQQPPSRAGRFLTSPEPADTAMLPLPPPASRRRRPLPPPPLPTPAHAAAPCTGAACAPSPPVPPRHGIPPVAARTPWRHPLRPPPPLPVAARAVPGARARAACRVRCRRCRRCSEHRRIPPPAAAPPAPQPAAACAQAAPPAPAAASAGPRRPLAKRSEQALRASPRAARTQASPAAPPHDEFNAAPGRIGAEPASVPAGAVGRQSATRVVPPRPAVPAHRGGGSPSGVENARPQRGPRRHRRPSARVLDAGQAGALKDYDKQLAGLRVTDERRNVIRHAPMPGQRHGWDVGVARAFAERAVRAALTAQCSDAAAAAWDAGLRTTHLTSRSAHKGAKETAAMTTSSATTA